MNILYIFPEDDSFGSPKSSIELIFELQKFRKYNPIVVTPKLNNINSICAKKNIKNYVVFNKPYTYNLKKDALSPLRLIKNYIEFQIGNQFALKKIKKIIDDEEIDIVHSTNSEIYIGSLINKKMKIPHVMHLREIWFNTPKRISFKKKSYSFLNNHTNFFISVSKHTTAQWKTYIKKPIITQYDKINYKLIPTKNYSKKNKKIQIVLLGYLGIIKNQNELIQSIAKLDKETKNNISVSLIGGGEKKIFKKMQKTIENQNMQNIIKIKKYLPNANRTLKNYDVGITCSLTEGLGRATIEYMSAKLAIIASNSGPNEELITPNVDGLIYQLGNTNELAKSIEYLVKNEEIRKKLGENARKKAIQIYNKTTNQAKSIYEIYKKLI